MSNHIALTLHYAEETIPIDVVTSLVAYPEGSIDNPVTDYFISSEQLVQKIIDTAYANDPQILGMLVLGVISSAEFYFRAVLSDIVRCCPVCVRHAESVNVPFGSAEFYSRSNFGSAMAAFEHVSLADSKKIIAEVKRFVGIDCNDSSSVRKALDEFEMLCELRHCFAHSKGFAGLKAMRAFNGVLTRA